MDTQWKRLIELSRRTGDPLVVMGTGEESPCVILPIDRYESLLGSGKPPVAPPAPPVPAPMPSREAGPRFAGPAPAPAPLPRKEREVVPPPPEPGPGEPVETQFYLEPIE